MEGYRTPTYDELWQRHETDAHDRLKDASPGEGWIRGDYFDAGTTYLFWAVRTAKGIRTGRARSESWCTRRQREAVREDAINN